MKNNNETERNLHRDYFKKKIMKNLVSVAETQQRIAARSRNMKKQDKDNDLSAICDFESEITGLNSPYQTYARKKTTTAKRWLQTKTFQNTSTKKVFT